MIGHPAGRWLILLLPAAVLLAAAPATAQTRVPMEFPPTGTRWINAARQQAVAADLASLEQALGP